MKNLLPIVLAVATALCWGLYGPIVANARSVAKPPLYSPFKPYVGVGLAYLVLAIVGGLVAMKMLHFIGLKDDDFTFTGAHFPALKWGFLAGAAGALGALALTTAMLKGGHEFPQVVMSIVFGGAVTVAAIVSLVQQRNASISPWLWVGIAGIVVSAILVAYNTPQPHPPASKADSHATGSAVDGSKHG